MKLKSLLLFCSLVVLPTAASAGNHSVGYMDELVAVESPVAQSPQRGKKTVIQKKGTASGQKSTASEPKSTVAKTPKKSAANKEKPTTKSSTSQKETGKRYIGMKTNLAYLGIGIQNLAVDLQVSNSLSLELPLMWSYWDIEQEHAVRTVTFQPELRWWTKKPGQGHFLGAHGHVGCFNVKWNDNRYQSTGRPLLGGGISYGYKYAFHARWGAEFTLGAGYANTKYDTFYNIDNGAKINTRNLNYWGITKVGISLVYRF